MFIKKEMLMTGRPRECASWTRYVLPLSVQSTAHRFVEWSVPVYALFKGRLVDRPESSKSETPETTGGEAKHEVYMLEGIILLVFELKLHFKNEIDYMAQVLLELACECGTCLRGVWKCHMDGRIIPIYIVRKFDSYVYVRLTIGTSCSGIMINCVS